MQSMDCTLDQHFLVSKISLAYIHHISQEQNDEEKEEQIKVTHNLDDLREESTKFLYPIGLAKNITAIETSKKILA